MSQEMDPNPMGDLILKWKRKIVVKELALLHDKELKQLVSMSNNLLQFDMLKLIQEERIGPGPEHVKLILRLITARLTNQANRRNYVQRNLALLEDNDLQDLVDASGGLLNLKILQRIKSGDLKPANTMINIIVAMFDFL